MHVNLCCTQLNRYLGVLLHELATHMQFFDEYQALHHHSPFFHDWNDENVTFLSHIRHMIDFNAT